MFRKSYIGKLRYKYIRRFAATFAIIIYRNEKYILSAISRLKTDNCGVIKPRQNSVLFLSRHCARELYARGSTDDRIADSERRLRGEERRCRGRASGFDGETRRPYVHGGRDRRADRRHTFTRRSDISDCLATQATQVFRQPDDRQSPFASRLYLRHRRERRGFDGVYPGGR